MLVTELDEIADVLFVVLVQAGVAQLDNAAMLLLGTLNDSLAGGVCVE